MQNFNELINSEQPVLVDFYATWCGPCKALSPILEQLKEQYNNQIQILKVEFLKPYVSTLMSIL